MKAFLSHSSTDKDLVSQVAQHLTRSRCVYDVYDFQGGVDFRESISKGLSNCELFVLFASKEALKRAYVKLEIDEAHLKIINNKMNSALVFNIDSDLRVEDFPDWMKRGLILNYRAPKAISREIEHRLVTLLSKRKTVPFIGRSADIDKIENVLAPLSGNPPRSIIVHGLPGIGRRTFARHVSSNVLNIHKHIEISIKDGDDLYDICRHLYTHVEIHQNLDELRDAFQKIKSLNYQELEKLFRQYLELISSRNEVVLFLDKGGIVENSGYLSSSALKIVTNVFQCPNSYIFFILSRKPSVQYPLEQIGQITLRPLTGKDTQKLISRLNKESSLSLSADDIFALSEFVAGYPLAAYYSIKQVEELTITPVLENKNNLVQFRATPFVRYINDSSLTEQQLRILIMLAYYEALPYRIIAENADDSTLQEDMKYLSDLALIHLNDARYFVLADPIADSVVQIIPNLEKSEIELINESIKHYILENSNEEQTIGILQLHRSLIKLDAISDLGKYSSDPLIFAGDIIQQAENSYRERDFRTSLDLCEKAIILRPESEKTHRFLIRSLIQLGEWNDAERAIIQYEKVTSSKETLFLRGFLARKAHKTEEAIKFYLSAIDSGYSGVDVYRELGLCFYVLEDLENSLKFAKIAREKLLDNAYVSDLLVLILIRMRQFDEADKELKKLKLIAPSSIYSHRRSRYHLAIGDFTAALFHAQNAYASPLNGKRRASYEIVANYVKCLILSGEIIQAERLLESLKRDYGNINPEVTLSLECRIAITQQKFDHARALLDKMPRKDTGSYYSLANAIDKKYMENIENKSTEEDLILDMNHLG